MYEVESVLPWCRLVFEELDKKATRDQTRLARARSLLLLIKELHSLPQDPLLQRAKQTYLAPEAG